MSVIKATLEDNILNLTNTPAIASGAIEVNEIEFTFDETWDDLLKTAVFYINRSEAYYAAVDNQNKAKIPSQVLEFPGTMFFGVFGLTSSGEARKTSAVVPYQIMHGSFVPGVTPPEPTPDIYTQILTAFNSLITGDTHLINGVIEQNNGDGLRFWIGTQEEYEAIEEPMLNCLYLISDDGSGEIFSRLEALENKNNVIIWEGSEDLDGAAIEIENRAERPYKLFAFVVSKEYDSDDGGQMTLLGYRTPGEEPDDTFGRLDFAEFNGLHFYNNGYYNYYGRVAFEETEDGAGNDMAYGIKAFSAALPNMTGSGQLFLRKIIGIC